ncbi:hypothetical protein GCM10023340_00320 [Nocardioides marinquilinus]|uniref:RNA polymerase sigma-70 region 2 domain-containing protein n=1 Tax=Nocardioides marinquilinus TaxID=1210400 RepID=A0ABP9P3R0_9ACTN
MTPTDLAGLLDRAARHDRDAFAAFYDDTIDAAHLLARAVATSPDDVDGIVRNAYAQAWRGCGGFRSTDLSARAWMMRLVQLNAATGARRRSAGRPGRRPGRQHRR